MTAQPRWQAVTYLAPVVGRLAHGGTRRAAITVQNTVVGGGNHSEAGSAHAGIQGHRAYGDNRNSKRGT